MRPLLHGDISCAARVLYALPQMFRERICRRMIAEAVIAGQYRRVSGRLHPVFGNGSLMSAARKRQLANEPGFDDVDYCRCFDLVLQCLIERDVSATRS